MTIETLEKEIAAIRDFIEVISLPVESDQDFVLRCYIETESISKTKSMISGKIMENGNKYQVNDIRDLIIKGADVADSRINDLAYRIYKANKKQSGRR